MMTNDYQLSCYDSIVKLISDSGSLIQLSLILVLILINPDIFIHWQLIHLILINPLIHGQLILVSTDHI